MATGTGVQAQLAITPGSSGESSYGTFTAATRGFEFNSESLAYRKNVVQSMGLKGTGSANLPLSTRRVVTTSDAGGDFEVDLMTQGCGILLAHCMGTFPTLSAGAFAFTLGDPSAKSFSMQVQVPQYDGTLTTKTLTGCKVTQFEIGVDAQGIAKLKTTVDAQALTTGTAASSVTYVTAGVPLHFAGAALKIDDTASTIVKDFTLTVDNSLKVDRYNLSGTGTKQAPVQSGFRKVTGKFSAEFSGTGILTKFLADTNIKLQLTVTNGSSSLDILIPVARLNGDTPQVKGPDAVDVDFEFEVLFDGTNAPLTVTYTTADTSL
jgi:Phage tail tube protein